MGEKSYHHGDLRAALLGGVAEILRERGIAFVSLREVARRANVSHAAPAHHFRNKAALLTAFASQGYARLEETVRACVAAETETSAPRQLEALGRGYVRFAVENPEQFGIMFRRELLNVADVELVARCDSAYARLSSAIRACVMEGYIETADAERVTVASWSMVHGLATLMISGRIASRINEPDPTRLAAEVTRLFVESVMPDVKPIPFPTRARGMTKARARS